MSIQTAGIAFGGTGLCSSYRVRGVDGSCAKHLTVESYTIIISLQSYLLSHLFKARLDKFWKHQSVKFDFTADLTGTAERYSSGLDTHLCYYVISRPTAFNYRSLCDRKRDAILTCYQKPT